MSDGYPAFTRICWWASGVDDALIRDPDCPTSEQIRFAALGLCIVLATAAALVAGVMIAWQVMLPGPGGALRALLRALLAVPAALFSALMVLNLLRLTVGLAGRRSDRIELLSPDALRAVAILAVTGVLAVAVAAPLQVALVERDVQAEALMERQAAALGSARAADLAQAASDRPLSAAQRLERETALRPQVGLFRGVGLAYATNGLLCWSVLIAVWLLLALPPVIRLLTDRGPYDFLVLHRNRALLAAAGIEPQAFTLHAPDGTPHHVDAFHAARALHSARLAEVLGERRRHAAALLERRDGPPAQEAVP